MAPQAEGSVPVRRALLSADDRSGLVEFTRRLTELGIETWATGGTRRALADAGLSVRAAEDLTGIGAWFSGRIKTLHPGLLGGILAPRTPEGLRELGERGLLPIDLVAVTFYPFARRLQEDPRAADLEEFIDVGGVTLARAAAKNHAGVAVLTSPSQYGPVAEELAVRGGSVSDATRVRLAVEAFEATSAYDRLIARGLARGNAGSGPWPTLLGARRDPLRLRYGENPHQAAAAYRLEPADGLRPAEFTLVKGDALSYTNLLDLDTALATVVEFPEPAAAVVKHATPVGVATARTVGEALQAAIATDPVARYGCVVATNRPISAGDPAAFHQVYVDLLAAPAFDGEALATLGRRPKVKLVTVEPPARGVPRWEAHSALGRVLLQEADERELDRAQVRCVTQRTATDEEIASLLFAWKVVRHAKSNAIALARGSATVGIGSGQPTRVKAVELAVEVAGSRAPGTVLASDAFFPFADGVEAAARAGVVAIVQPGGSLRDPEVIAAADRAHLAMYFTGWRVFRH